MKRTFLALMTVWVILLAAGCGEGGDSHHRFTGEILSDANIDGDIRLDPNTGFLTVTRVVNDAAVSVFAGVNPSTLEESRAVLDFNLDSVPLDAVIDSATLDIVIDSILPINGSIPLRIDLVDFAPPLVGTDFDRALLPPLETMTVVPPVSPADLNLHLLIDVTALMTVAQVEGRADFQIRILEDFGIAVSPGLIEIDERSDATAPLLKVVFH
jgi:hypothetical protein